MSGFDTEEIIEELFHYFLQSSEQSIKGSNFRLIL